MDNPSASDSPNNAIATPSKENANDEKSLDSKKDESTNVITAEASASSHSPSPSSGSPSSSRETTDSPTQQQQQQTGNHRNNSNNNQNGSKVKEIEEYKVHYAAIDNSFKNSMFFMSMIILDGIVSK